MGYTGDTGSVGRRGGGARTYSRCLPCVDPNEAVQCSRLECGFLADKLRLKKHTDPPPPLLPPPPTTQTSSPLPAAPAAARRASGATLLAAPWATCAAAEAGECALDLSPLPLASPRRWPLWPPGRHRPARSNIRLPCRGWLIAPLFPCQWRTQSAFREDQPTHSHPAEQRMLPCPSPLPSRHALLPRPPACMATHDAPPPAFMHLACFCPPLSSPSD